MRYSPLIALLCLRAYSPSPTFLERSVIVGGHQYRYRVWLPHHYTKLMRWPVILYLHGRGERGDDNMKQLTVGLPLALQQYPLRYRAIVVIPQCARRREWYGAMEQQALAALAASMREFHGDPQRVFITGLSMGGAGAWYMARHRGRFAAVIPICGEVTRRADEPFPTALPPDLARIIGARDPYATLAAAIGPTPVWAFHGECDDTIPVTQSRRMTTALRAVGGEVQYTEYTGVDHYSWDLAYADERLAQWILSKRLE